MNTAVINIKTEPKVKLAAQKLADEFGLSLSAMINGLLHQVIKTKTLIFSAEDESQPTEYLLESLRASKEDFKEGRTSPAFTNIKDAQKWLDENIPENKHAD